MHTLFAKGKRNGKRNTHSHTKLRGENKTEHPIYRPIWIRCMLEMREKPLKRKIITFIRDEDRRLCICTQHISKYSNKITANKSTNIYFNGKANVNNVICVRKRTSNGGTIQTLHF